VTDDERCIEVMVDGTTAARIRWAGEMTPQDVAAIQALVRAVRDKTDDDGP
jgi:hypothetical protein